MSSTPPRATQRDNSSVTTLPPVSDTPSKIKQSVSAPVICSKKLDQGREAVVQDVGSNVPEVPVQWFMDNILPRPLPNFNLHDIIQRLESAGHITSGAWTKFDKLPAQSPKTEDDVFAALEPIARAIGEQAIEQAREQARDQPGSTLLKISEPTVVFQCRPKSTPRSLRRYSASRPDGYGLYINHPSHGYSTDGRPFWEAIVAPCEFKKKQAIEDINDNIAKILWSFHHIMRDDPTRRFVVGYTIENTDMRLWFGSRTDALVTEPFNFIRDVETLTHFYLALMFAEAHELGYDPTMRPAGDPSRWRNSWDITVHDGSHLDTSQPVDVSKLRTVVFRTGEVESNIGAEAMRSRGTRVWRVRKIKSGGGLDDKGGGLDDKVMVLKDYWVDHDRLREATIRQRILDDAENDEEKATLEKHLLTPLYSGDVIIAGQRDNTHSLLRRGAEVPVGSLYPTYHEEKPSTVGTIPEDEPYAPQGTGTIGAREDRIESLMMLNDKSHHRIVFEEVASTIEHVETVRGVFQVAQQATTALKSMHKCGWVHRDISSGNILIVDGIVKIGDLEYAKRLDDDTSHAGRSGTALYMSIEAICHKYLFGPRHDSLSSELDLVFDDGAGDSLDASESRTPFRYNPLHDIESLWWVLVYLLLNRSADIPGYDLLRRRTQLEFYNRAFTGYLPPRQIMFQLLGEFADGIKTLHARLVPIAKALEWARKSLNKRYEEIEAGDLTLIDNKVADGVASQLETLFKRAVKLYEGDSDVRLHPLRPPSRRKTTPEEPGAATAIGTSLDFHAEGSRKRRADEVESTVINYPEFKELQENLKKRKPNKTGEVESDGKATEATEVLQQVVEEDKTDVKGKGKARELPDDSDSVSESHSSDGDLYQ